MLACSHLRDVDVFRVFRVFPLKLEAWSIDDGLVLNMPLFKASILTNFLLTSMWLVDVIYLICKISKVHLTQGCSIEFKRLLQGT